ncbi:hypothetical protein ABDK09_04815 [Vibrio sp. CDRSL-10 TSBA]
MRNMINVSKLPTDRGEAAWNAILGKQVSYPQVDCNTSYDWVIVGGGFAGLAAARRLTQLVGAGERIAVSRSTAARARSGRT